MSEHKTIWRLPFGWGDVGALCLALLVPLAFVGVGVLLFMSDSHNGTKRPPGYHYPSANEDPCSYRIMGLCEP